MSQYPPQQPWPSQQPPNYGQAQTATPPPPPYQQPAPLPQPQKPAKKPRTWLWVTLALFLGLVIGYGIHTPPADSTSTATTATTTQQSSAATQPASQPATQAPTQKPTAAPKWITTHTFTGNGTKKTAYFTVPNDWKLVWKCDPASFGVPYNVIVAVTGSDGTPIDPTAVNTLCKSGNTGDSTDEHQGGQVYLEVTSEGSWTLQVQELK